MQIEINYFEKGKEKIINVDINFVPNHVFREFQYITETIGKTIGITSQMQGKFKEIEAVSKDKPEGWQEKLQELSDELGKLSNELKKYEDNDFFKRRFEIMRFLLIKNGIDENDKMCTFEFWDEDVHPHEILRILSEVTKIDSKKKVNPKKNTT